jgi:sialic acid synthase SpsE
VGIEFMCTPFGVAELLFLKPLLKRIKIASGCIARKPLLRRLGIPDCR